MFLVASGMVVYNLDCDAYGFCNEAFNTLYSAYFWLVIGPLVFSLVIGSCLCVCLCFGISIAASKK